MNNEKEIRLQNVEYREEGEQLILEGYPIVWDTETLIGNEEHGFYESISRNSLDNAYMKDVPLKYNHMDNTYILARTRNKSLVLTPDDKGLFMRATLQGDVQAHRDVYNMVKSGLLDKMSFAFNVVRQDVDVRSGVPHRKVLEIGRLFDVSVVDVPAYDQTSIYARSLDLVDTELKALDNARAESVDTDKEMELEIEKLKNENLIKLLK